MRSAIRGLRCEAWQRVRVGGRRLLRCKRFDIPNRGAIGYQRGHTPSNYGAVCLRRKRVYSPWFDKQVWRCAEFGRGVRRAETLFKASPTPRVIVAPMKPRIPKAAFTFEDDAYVPLSLPSMERMHAGRTRPKRVSARAGRR